MNTPNTHDTPDTPGTPDTPLDEITLTAYALGELDEPRRSQIQSLLKHDPLAAQQVAEIRSAADSIELALADQPALSLSDEHRQKIAAAAAAEPVTITPPPSRLRLSRWTKFALAACLMLAAGLVFLPSLSYHRTHAKMDPTLAALKLLEVENTRISKLDDPAAPLPDSNDMVMINGTTLNLGSDAQPLGVSILTPIDAFKFNEGVEKVGIEKVSGVEKVSDTFSVSTFSVSTERLATLSTDSQIHSIGGTVNFAGTGATTVQSPAIALSTDNAYISGVPINRGELGLATMQGAGTNTSSTPQTPIQNDGYSLAANNAAGGSLFYGTIANGVGGVVQIPATPAVPHPQSGTATVDLNVTGGVAIKGNPTSAYVSGVPINAGTLRVEQLSAAKPAAGPAESEVVAQVVAGVPVQVMAKEKQTQIGLGAVALNAASDYTGVTTLNRETVMLNEGVNNTIGGNAGLTVFGGTVNLGSATSQVIEAYSIGGGISRADSSASRPLALGDVQFGTIKANRTLTIQGSGDTVINGNVLQGTTNDGYILTKAGSGTLQVRGANPTGAEKVSDTLSVSGGNNTQTGFVGGMLQLAHTANIGTASALGRDGYAASSNVLHYTGSGETAGRMIRLNNSTGSTQIVADGSGALTITGVVGEKVSGTFSVAAGTQVVDLMKSGQRWTVSDAEVEKGSDPLSVPSFTFAGTGSTTILSDDVITSGTPQPIKLGQIAASNYALAKTNTGTLTLTGASTYNFDGGTLTVTNPGDSGTVVLNNGTVQLSDVSKAMPGATLSVRGSAGIDQDSRSKPQEIALDLNIVAADERPLVRNLVAYDVQRKELKDLEEIRDPKPALQVPEPELLMKEQQVQEQLFRRRQLQEQWRERQGNTAEYARINDNPFQNSLQQPLSTFSIDVDTGSYANIRRFITSGQLPPPDAVRIEEMLNYFNYYYEPPVDGKPFATHVEVAGCPWNPGHQLVKIGIKGREIDRKQRPPSNLVFLLDVSGSMEPQDRLPLIKSAMKLMTRELTENDKVSIVVYAGSSGLVLPCTNGANQNRILEALDRLHAGGSTNGGQGIQLAYQIAQENFIQGGVNRVILATDGDFNVGVTDRGQLISMIEKYRQSGVFLSVLGVGTDNLKDATMEQLADKGNGVYAYLDSLREGRRVLVEQMSGTLVTIAKDVKIQVEFNPSMVAGYRLIGYENRVMAAEDFNNDKKDAGDIGAGHTVTALYEIIPGPAGMQGPEGDKPKPDVDELKYQKPIAVAAPVKIVAGNGELMTVKLRYKLPDENVSTKIEYPVKDAGVRFEEAGKDFQFAAAVASFGMQLRNSPHRGTFTFEQVQQVAERNLSNDPQGYRAEFIELVRRVRQMIGEN